MSCSRCRGMMVREKYFGQGESYSGWRCVNCGEIIDPLILDNRNGRKGSGSEI
jgi:hypothetical protein